MCGITGVVSKRSDDLINQVRKSVCTLTNRGKDSSGTLTTSDHLAIFGHTRLSIIDLTARANQPLVSSCSRYTITYNGEIYNTDFLFTRLGISKSSGYSDTFLLLEHISRFGLSSTLELVDGMFAFALWDSSVKKVYLCRDIHGQKPLYYYSNADSLFFSSTLSALYAYKSFPSDLDENNFAIYLSLKWYPDPLTPYKNVYKLPIGSVLEYSPLTNTLDLHDISKGSNTSCSNLPSKQPNLYALFKSSFFSTVRNCLHSDVPVGIFLSGGIDSSLVALGAARNGAMCPTFSIGFESKEFDESKYAERIASSLGLSHESFVFSNQELLESLSYFQSIYDEPLADPSCLPSILLCQYVSSKVKVALGGDGADELFGGYTRYKNILDFQKLSNLPLLFLFGFIA